ncbi:DUF3284 domain-containing protein [Enterococcus sp. LJL120]
MKITRVLKVANDEFYDYLEDELLADLNVSHNSLTGVKKIRKGLRYQKQDEQQTPVDITIEEYIRGEVYQATISTQYDTITISYETEKDPKGLKVDFTQSIESFQSKKHNKIMKAFSEGVYLGRMTDTLYKIQDSIEKRR